MKNGIALDYNSDIVYYPVRHHSPACSVHLKNVIRDYKPDCILIEGPEDGSHLIKYLGSDEIKPPVCIYYGFDDKNGLVSDDNEKYRAYYPFLDYSPELTAMREGQKLGIPSCFIDMPYALQLVQFGKCEKTLKRFSDDSTAVYYNKAAEKSGCRSFSEFWELGFEVNGLEKTDEEFVNSVRILGRYMRELSPADETNRYREAFMRSRIAKYKTQYKKILVVAGAYHIDGLENDTEKLDFKHYSKADASLYLVPYSFPEADSRNGYGAGIPFPAFYSSVWKKIISGKPQPYSETVQEYILGAARYARSKNEHISLTDEIQAKYMAHELASLRGKAQPGAFELTDGVRSAFVKGSIDSSASFELDYLFNIMTGLGAGEVNISDESADITPPCVIDFRVQCRKFRINLRTAARQNIILDIVKNKTHSEKSAFLHRMAFLEINFAHTESGPDYVNNVDTSLIREHWSVRYSTEVEAKLTDLAVFGGTISDICMNLLARKFSSSQNGEAIGKFLLFTYTMGFADKAEQFLPSAAEKLRDDTDFLSQCDFMLYANKVIILLRTIFSRSDISVLGLLKISFMTALNKLESVKNADNNSAERICSGIRMMYSLTTDYPQYCSQWDFLEEMKKISVGAAASPRIYGVCLSICAKSNIFSNEEYCEAVSGYMKTSDGKSAADFLSGVISVGRDVILNNENVLESIDTAISAMEHDDFMSSLPFFRRAFTSFLPQETAKISSKIAEHYGTSSESIEGSFIFSAEEIIFASECDRKARRIMEKWGMFEGGEYND